MAMRIRRRELAAVLSGAVVWPLMVRAQQTIMKRIGVLTLSSDKADKAFQAAFVDGLLRRGYVEGKNLVIDYRYADGSVARLVPLAEQLLSLRPDVLLGGEPSAARALKKVAPTLPIVCPLLTQSVLPEFAASYARPGGNVTGIAFNVEGMSGKLLELAQEVVPAAVRVGFLSNPTGASMTFFARGIEEAASHRKIAVLTEQVTTSEGLAPAFERLKQRIADAVIVPLNGLFQNEAPQIAQLALSARLPTIFAERHSVQVGGLASYGVDEKETFQRAADYVDRILKGAKPAEMPIEFPTKIELVINLKTAKTLGLDVPLHLQQRADEVIE
jgi:putative ABC transport system substrate-binding protein